MLLRWIVPGDEVEVVVDGGVLELIRVADDGVEVAFRRGEEVGIVHQDDPRKVIPTPQAVLDEGLRKHHPCGT